MSDDNPELQSIKCDRCGEDILSGEFRTTDGTANYHPGCHFDAIENNDRAGLPVDEPSAKAEGSAA
jgi:hypothetical protein